jgi:rhamnogalacturonan acetylesterase
MKLPSSCRNGRACSSLTFLFPTIALSAALSAQDPQATPNPPPAPTPPPASSQPTLPEPTNPELPSLFLVGDSTVRTGRGDGANGQWGWGEPLTAYFDTARINVVNRALGGRSSRTYQTQGHWDRTRPLMKPGDFVLIQFGHNDSSAVNDDSRARGALPGIGDETQEIDNLLTHERETVHTYGWYLRKLIRETNERGAVPIVCSMVPRKIWEDGKLARNVGGYAGWARQVAQAEAVAFIDLNDSIARRYEELGTEAVSALFADRDTHTTLQGAELNATAVVFGLKSLKLDPLCRFLSPKADAVKPVIPVRAE